MVESIKMEMINSANITFSNANDAARVYDVRANVNISNGTAIQSYDSGTVTVKDNQTQIATFNSYSPDSLSITFYSSPTLEIQKAVMTAIDTFKADLVTYVQSNGASLINV